MSTAADWVAPRHAAIDRLADRMAAQHGELTIPANPKVTITVDWLDQLRIIVGTSKVKGALVTGRQLTATIASGRVELWDTTFTDSTFFRQPLSRARLGPTMTAQQVIDRLCAEIGPNQCAVCGEFGDHHAGTDERPWCAEHCPDCNEGDAA